MRPWADTEFGPDVLGNALASTGRFSLSRLGDDSVLFGKKMEQPTDVVGGELDDCWVAASLSLLACNPALIRSLFLAECNW